MLFLVRFVCNLACFDALAMTNRMLSRGCLHGEISKGGSSIVMIGNGLQCQICSVNSATVGTDLILS